MDKEHYRARILDVFITKIGLTFKMVQQLEDILQQQFHPNHAGEVSGHIFLNHGAEELEFKVVDSPVVEEVRQALKHFLKGDYGQLDVLYSFSQEALEEHTQHHNEISNLEMMRAVTHFFDIIRKKPAEERNQLSYPTRKKWVDLYRTKILDHYFTNTSEKRPDGEGFVGLFHVHKQGRPPSPLDLAENETLQIPSLVLAAAADYASSGIKLYLVTYGAYNELYQGPLQPK